MDRPKCKCGGTDGGLIYMLGRYWCVSCVERRITELESTRAEMSIEEENRLRRQDIKSLDDSIAWLKDFWWSNRKPISHTGYDRDARQAVYETERAIGALINLRRS